MIAVAPARSPVASIIAARQAATRRVLAQRAVQSARAAVQAPTKIQELKKPITAAQQVVNKTAAEIQKRVELEKAKEEAARRAMIQRKVIDVDEAAKRQLETWAAINPEWTKQTPRSSPWSVSNISTKPQDTFTATDTRAVLQVQQTAAQTAKKAPIAAGKSLMPSKARTALVPETPKPGELFRKTPEGGAGIPWVLIGAGAIGLLWFLKR